MPDELARRVMDTIAETQHLEPDTVTIDRTFSIIISVLLVGILTWFVMPFFSRYIFRKFLYRQN